LPRFEDLPRLALPSVEDAYLSAIGYDTDMWGGGQHGI
jgi:hypothetical protein